MCTRKVQALTSTVCSTSKTAHGIFTSISKVSSFISQAGCPAHSVLLVPNVNSLFPFQMAAPNFERILLMLKDVGSIPQYTLHSQDGLNLGDICFCPLICMLRMQLLSINGLRTLLTRGAFMPPRSKRPTELSRMTAILLTSRWTAGMRKLPTFMWDSWYAKLSPTYITLTRSLILSRT